MLSFQICCFSVQQKLWLTLVTWKLLIAVDQCLVYNTLSGTAIHIQSWKTVQWLKIYWSFSKATMDRPSPPLATSLSSSSIQMTSFLGGNQSFHGQHHQHTTSMAIRHEIQRFESVHPSIYAIYDLIELVPDPLLAQQIREHVVCIEGKIILAPYK